MVSSTLWPLYLRGKIPQYSLERKLLLMEERKFLTLLGL
jgi:hypothetical protein